MWRKTTSSTETQRSNTSAVTSPFIGTARVQATRMCNGFAEGLQRCHDGPRQRRRRRTCGRSAHRYLVIKQSRSEHDASVCFGPACLVARISVTGLLAQLLPLAPYPRGRLKFAESRRSIRSAQFQKAAISRCDGRVITSPSRRVQFANARRDPSATHVASIQLCLRRTFPIVRN